MKQLQLLLITGIVISFFSCNNENPVTPVNPGSFQGEWTVDKVQMVQAPSGGGVSAMMKQALVPFGGVSGSFVGYLDMKFGAETIVSTNTNLDYGESYFIGNIGYYQTNSRLYKSADGGITWNEINLPFSASFISTYVRSESTIYIIRTSSGGTELLKSTNSGSSWSIINEDINAGTSGGLNKNFCFVTDAIGYVKTSNKVYKTTNSGLDWNEIYTVTGYLETISFSSESTGSVQFLDFQTQTKKFSKTTNGGLNWTSHSSPANINVFDSFVLNENSIWVYSIYSESNLKCYLYKTNDCGQTWNMVTDKIPFIQVKFINENIGYGVTLDNFLLKTNNGGSTWDTYSTPPDLTSFPNINFFNEQPVFYTTGKFWKPSGIIDTTKWAANGMITNSAIQLITNAISTEWHANGDFSINSNNIIFTVYNYFYTHNKVGTGTFSFENNNLNFDLNLPNDEKWKVKLRRK